MTFTIMRGFADSDFRAELLQRIYKKYQTQNEARFFYIVPNHIKFSAEVDVLKKFGRLLGQNDQDAQAFSRLQVYSLSRLAWALTKQRDEKPPITNEMLAILVGKVLRQIPIEMLSIFARSARLPGFVANVSDQLIEIWNSGLTAAEIAQTHHISDRLTEKIKLLFLVEKQLMPYLTNYSLPNDNLKIFAQQLSGLDLLHDNFYFEGFSGFTASELNLLQSLIQAEQAKQMGPNSDIVISLLGDAASDRYGEGNLFFKANQLLKKEFSQAKIEYAEKKRALSASQVHFEQSWRELETVGSVQQKRSLAHMKVCVLSDQTHEIDFVARSIRQKLLADPSLRAKDILLLAQRLGDYKNIIPAIFKRYDLPFFLDKDTRMSDHPLSLLLENLFATTEEFSYERVMRIFRTGLISWAQPQDFQEALDYLENYILANNPTDKNWREDRFQLIKIMDEQDLTTDSQTDQAINDSINQMRLFIVAILDKFKKTFQLVTNYHEAVRTLLSWLLDAHVDQIVADQANDANDRGLQAWKLLISALDEVDRLIGDEKYSQKDFLQILKDAFAAASFSGIPAGLDQITISETGIVQKNDYKMLFFIDATDQSLPSQVTSSSMIDDFDRNQLSQDFATAKMPYYLQDTSRQQMAAENNRFYSSVLSSTEQVIFSYPKLRIDGKQNNISPYLDRLLLKNVSDLRLTKVPDLPQSTNDLVDYIGTAKSSIAVVNQSVQNFGQNFIGGLDELLLQRDPHFKRIMRAADYRNQPVIIRPELIEKLFGQDLKLSISQIEKYYSNPYEYFLQYGLRLKTRKQFVVDAALSGVYYHAIFEKVVNQLIDQSKKFRDLSNQQLENITRQISMNLTESADFEILRSDAHFQAVGQSLVNDVSSTIQLMRQANTLNDAQPVRTEAIFGRLDQQSENSALSGLDFTLANGHKIFLRGKIDRIDAQDLDRLFSTIVDYKSNGKSFDFRDAYVGTELQLLTYWLAIAKNHSQLNIGQPAGAVFAQIRNRPLDITSLIAKHVNPAQLIGPLASLQAPDFKFRGILLDNSDYLNNLQMLENGEKAQYYNYSLTKKGQKGASNDIISQSDLKLLLNHDKKKLIEAGNQISRGFFPLLPVKESEQRTALTYSDYKTIMNFDRIFGDHYHNLQAYPDKKKEILAKMREEDGDIS